MNSIPSKIFNTVRNNSKEVDTYQRPFPLYRNQDDKECVVATLGCSNKQGLRSQALFTSSAVAVKCW